ncbi:MULTISPECIES: Tox-REase-5 domain-containing protein [unclassified Gordonia (in: high G+C Gram-positive bacteria)]|uniref:Tox-REase-5 domain-containing protein n=1 Tax=unclassified Gordonia (in: high G+C Gram-positive bacteria) TaxID=2657482 RepID=UPI00071E3AA2|nr:MULTISPECIES: Tox-REase-5 domain-containing protein [unclassified Gordonia (in: high G+C Gram-positive bacteria)]KSU53319.1 hypothetical protein AS181_22045 [Gordonia sp. SGD-V-85]SCC55952.1 Restriction endonuclease fold toxin 5 [Gordonia sp. v-85]
MTALTRSAVRAWTAAAAAATARGSLTSQASVLEAASTRIRDGGSNLGHDGGWSGIGYQNAFATVDQHYTTNIRTADIVTQAGDAAYNGLTEMHYAAVALLAQADAAEADGCKVSDTWQVTAADTGSDDAEARVALWQPIITRYYHQLENADNASSGKIQTVAFPLLLGALAGASLLEIAAVAFAAAAATVGVALAISWAIEHFPDIDINELLSRSNLDTTGGGSGEWVPENETGWSKEASDYERQVTGTDSGVTYKIPSEDAPSGAIKVDGMEPATDDSRETWIEAKGTASYDWMIEDDGSIRKNTKFAEQLPDQLQRQYDAAEEHDAEVEWRVATPALEKAIKRQIEDLGLGDRIRVEHIPPEK